MKNSRKDETKIFPPTALAIQIRPAGREAYVYDLRILLFLGGAALAPQQNDMQEVRKTLGEPIFERIPLLIDIHNLLCFQIQMGAGQRSIFARIMNLRHFFKFCESMDLALEHSIESARLALTKWIEHLWTKIRRHEIKEQTGQSYIWQILAIYREIFNSHIEELVGRTTLPVGCYENRRNEKVDINAVDKFLIDLEDIIDSLSLEAIRGNWPIKISFRSGETINYNGQGRKPNNAIYPLSKKSPNYYRCKKRNEDISYKMRKLPISLRTEAELLAFIGTTGLNLQVALDLKITDINYQSFGDQYQVSGFKNRKHDKVEVRIPKSYRSKLETWLTFRSQAFSEFEIEKLFPFLSHKNKESTIGGERGFPFVESILNQAGKSRFTPSTLRYVRAQKLIRTSAIGGDLRKVASELQHSAPTLLRNYVKGSQQMATVELSQYFNIIPAGKNENRVRSGGDCGKPNSPKKIDTNLGLVATPDCINPSGCLFCSHYRAIEGFDYALSILSYKEFLKLRLNLTKSNFGLDPIIVSAIEKIDEIVTYLKGLSRRMNTDIQDAAEKIKEGNFHPTWHGWIEMLMFPEN